MIRLVLFAALLALWPADAFCEERPNLLDEGRSFIEQGEYSTALKALRRASKDRSLSIEQRTEAMVELGSFYENLAGRYDHALSFYRKALRLKQAAGTPAYEQARQGMERLTALKKTYAEQDKALQQVRAESSRLIRANTAEEKTAAMGRIDFLRDFIRGNPDYYAMHEVRYYLGANHAAIQEYADAYEQFEQVLAFKPAVHLALPVKTAAELAHTNMVRERLNTWSSAAAGFGVVAAALAFFLARPWRWATWRHAAFGAGLIALWAGVFYGSFAVIEELYDPSKTVNVEGRYERPCYVNCALGAPGSEVAEQLFSYGLMGLGGVFFFSLGVGGIRPRLLAAGLGGLYAAVVFSGLLTVYYMRHFESHSTFNVQEGSVLHLLQGNLSFALLEPEPYVLVEPKAYPGLDVQGVNPGPFQDWLERYIPSERSFPSLIEQAQ